MTWTALLLADPSPCLRRLVLTELLGRGAGDPEVRELADLRETDPLIAGLVARQGPGGAWTAGDPAWTTAMAGRAGQIRATALALLRLGYLGCGPEHPAVARGAAYLFGCQRPDGAWDLPETDEEAAERASVRAGERGEEPAPVPDKMPEDGAMAPLQTAIPLRGLAACGYATDRRAERAYDWLLAQRLPDGAWPTGIVAGNYRRVGGYRRLAHSRWGCRSNTTGALICLAAHPERRHSPAAGRGLDLLLGRDTREESTLGWEVARLIGVEPFRGFLTFYARFDLALVLDLCRRIGATMDDERLAGMVRFVRGLQGPYGLWEYRARPQAARWVTFDLLRSLAGIDAAGDWLSSEPPTPFQAYARRAPRY